MNCNCTPITQFNRSNANEGAAVAFPRALLHKIGIRFVLVASLQPQITKIMKPSTMTQNKTTDASLFQIAAHLETAAFTSDTKLTPPPDLKPFADSLVHPKSTGRALKAAKSEPAKTGENSSGGVTSKRGSNRSSGKPSRSQLVKTEFHLEAPQAKSVKLAADFTEWDKSPLDLVKTENGVWQIVVPLPLGDHAYRFIVDGQWCDDPRPALRVPNPFGTANTIMKVV